MASPIFAMRKWLNRKGSHSSGSVFAYYGPSPWDNGSDWQYLLEVADCHGKIRLHKTDADSPKDFIKKLKRLRDVIDCFISFLERNHAEQRANR